MTHEIDNMDLYFVFRNRPVFDPDRRRSVSVAWPRKPFVPTRYKRGEREESEVHRVFDAADRANARCREYCDMLNAQRGIHERT
jgi:hypothetical protein